MKLQSGRRIYRIYNARAGSGGLAEALDQVFLSSVEFPIRLRGTACVRHEITNRKTLRLKYPNGILRLEYDIYFPSRDFYVLLNTRW